MKDQIWKQCSKVILTLNEHILRITTIFEKARISVHLKLQLIILPDYKK